MPGRIARDMSQQGAQFERLRFITRLALVFAAAMLAGLPLLMALLRISGEGPAWPGDLDQARAQLPLLMALSGLLLAALIGAATWFIALHGSFRVVGPLHRFCMDLEQGIGSGRLPRIRIRATDGMQDQARYFEDAADHLDRHLDALAAAIESAALAVRRGRPAGDRRPCPGERVHRLIEELRL